MSALFLVRYEVATYVGTRWVVAEDDEHARAQVRRWVAAQHPPIGFERYTVVERREEAEGIDTEAG